MCKPLSDRTATTTLTPLRPFSPPPPLASFVDAAYPRDAFRVLQTTPLHTQVRIITSNNCLSAGDALRDIDQRGVVRSDPFILVSGDVVSNIDLKSVIKQVLFGHGPSVWFISAASISINLPFLGLSYHCSLMFLVAPTAVVAVAFLVDFGIVSTRDTCLALLCDTAMAVVLVLRTSRPN